ncbi:TfoX/Sxy family protein [Mucilaginibacter auburnensis]|uniref:TfoX-like protein n=1 Tax=Mucilaginibacter auburnensis TaxID=1457233 RepID=A0A2H9VV65_9SPHI|nr:TfoX/Sxy family protein [Mucilaginibacter auburnensis]PJJ84708.1 TfoX-like protein [Mucilaginibacter auburnensis]
MALNEALANRIREALFNKGITNVEEKKMFSGMCFMVDGKMCVCASDDEMLCRVGPMYLEALEIHGIRGMIRNGKPLKDYIYVSPELLNDDKTFNYWIDTSLAFNKFAKATKSKKTKAGS